MTVESPLIAQGRDVPTRSKLTYIYDNNVNLESAFEAQAQLYDLLVGPTSEIHSDQNLHPGVLYILPRNLQSIMIKPTVRTIRKKKEQTK